MVERCLRRHGQSFGYDKDGDVAFIMPYSAEQGCELDFRIYMAGEKRDRLTVLALSNRQIPKQEWGRCLAACNEWNRGSTSSKAYLRTGAQPPLRPARFASLGRYPWAPASTKSFSTRSSSPRGGGHRVLDRHDGGRQALRGKR